MNRSPFFMRKFKDYGRMMFISMTITDSMEQNTVSLIKLEKSEDQKIEEQSNYNSFMNFMTDIIVRYGLNENTH